MSLSSSASQGSWSSSTAFVHYDHKICAEEPAGICNRVNEVCNLGYVRRTPGLGLGRNWDTHGSSHTLMDRPLFTWKHNHFSSRFFTFNIPFQHHDEIEAPEA